ncbi:uncharacterized protein LOC135466670 [Liolophura sinensis]|uniref:uncharacterized protein LOC135466670 n=1 Tax=Liolophura sinensis TaxID=3198878 RepID=UPI0031588653
MPLGSCQQRCCMPSQWESPIGILEGFHSTHTNTSGEVEGIDRISYDYPNKRVAGTMTVTSGGKPVSKIKSITDFHRKKTYIISDKNCSVSDIDGNEKRKDWECIPDDATYAGLTYFGGGNQRLYVDQWHYKIKGMDVRMDFARPSCVPVSEAVTGQLSADMDGLVLVSYSGLTLGIRDERVFDPPENCKHSGQTITVGGSGTVGGIIGRMRRQAKHEP